MLLLFISCMPTLNFLFSVTLSVCVREKYIRLPIFSFFFFFLSLGNPQTICKNFHTYTNVATCVVIFENLVLINRGDGGGGAEVSTTKTGGAARERASNGPYSTSTSS